MKIIANKPKCCGHARCATVAPEVFRLDSDGYIDVAEIEVTPGQEQAARRGARACPERVFTVVDDAKP